MYKTEVNTAEDFLICRWKTWIEEAQNIQNYSYDNMKNDPLLLKDMDKLVERLLIAKENNEHITIFWDFDCDWVSWIAVILKWLRYLWFENIDYIVPDRKIWYSIQTEYVEKYLVNNNKPDLIITVDCWIKSITDIKYIVNVIWIDVIITDHHLIGIDNVSKKMILPTDAIAIVNHKRNDCLYPNKDMSWSFVALKVIEALSQSINLIDWPDWDPDYAMNELEELATLWVVADVMSISGENWLLVKDSLSRYVDSKNIWIKFFTSAVKGLIDTTLIWYRIWPRINAAWRLEDATIWLKALLVETEEEAEQYFNQLSEINTTRKNIVKEDFDFAFENVDNSHNGICYLKWELLDWIIGLIAGKFKENFYKPSIVIWGKIEKERIVIDNKLWNEILEKDIIYKWSCRSIDGVHILDILDKLSDLLIWYWWHALAAGFSIKEENLKEFIKRYYEICDETIDEETLINKIITDWLIRDFSIIDEWFLNILNLLQPFWQSNPFPIFILEWKIKYINFMWAQKNHLKIIFQDNYWEQIDWIFWNYIWNVIIYDLVKNLKPWDEIYLLWNLSMNYYLWNTKRQLMIKDIIII
jgi:single-stranded-DNA-specific exonuclease